MHYHSRLLGHEIKPGLGGWRPQDINSIAYQSVTLMVFLWFKHQGLFTALAELARKHSFGGCDDSRWERIDFRARLRAEPCIYISQIKIDLLTFYKAPSSYQPFGINLRTHQVWLWECFGACSVTSVYPGQVLLIHVPTIFYTPISSFRCVKGLGVERLSHFICKLMRIHF